MKKSLVFVRSMFPDNPGHKLCGVSRPLFASLAVLVLALTASPPTAAQAPRPIGGESRVNTTDYAVEDDLDSLAVAIAEGGHFIVTWNEEDGSYFFANSVIARRYASDGTALGDDFRVSDLDFYPSLEPDAAAAGDNFLVVWEDDEATPRQIFARHLDAAGTLGDPFAVSATAVPGQFDPAIDGGSDGFVVVWQQSYGAGDILGQRIDTAGARVGATFQVASPTEIGEEEPDIAVADDGRFAVVWNDGADIEFQLFDSVGQAQGATVELDVPSAGDLNARPSIAYGHDRYLVIWSVPDSSGVSDGDGNGLRYRFVDTGGSPIGVPVTLGVDTIGDQTRPDVTATNRGFQLTWTSPDGDGSGLKSRRFSTTGVFLGGVQTVNTSTTGTQRTSAVAAQGEGFIVAWVDDEVEQVKARRYDEPLFGDGFESGTTVFWDLVVGGP